MTVLDDIYNWFDSPVLVTKFGIILLKVLLVMKLLKAELLFNKFNEDKVELDTYDVVRVFVKT